LERNYHSIKSVVEVDDLMVEALMMIRDYYTKYASVDDGDRDMKQEWTKQSLLVDQNELIRIGEKEI
jgi:hypothetical protein